MEKLVSRFGVLVVLAVIVTLALRGDLLSTSPFVILGQVAGVALGVWARRSFPAGQFRVDGTPADGGLVRTGPYALIRHPMYTAALLFIWASILGHWSPLNALLGVVGIGLVLIRIPVEERLVAARYPEYLEYARTTKRVIPFLL